MSEQQYSSREEAKKILETLCGSSPLLSLPTPVIGVAKNVLFTAERDLPMLPIPFKQTETIAALKAIEGGVASVLLSVRHNLPEPPRITVSLEKATAFLFQAYLATVGGYGKLDPRVKGLIPDTDLLQAQSDPYRRMSANLYRTKRDGEYYHIHGSLEASTTLKMIGLEPFRPDLRDHESIVDTIESAVQQFTLEELEVMNLKHGQAGIPVLQHEEFLKSPHGQSMLDSSCWSIGKLESSTPECAFPHSGNGQALAGIKVLELCRIIAGPVITRILAEYGADVLKITSPNLSDVPFFQVDGNFGKHAANLDLKSTSGRKTFDDLLAEADVVVDGYRPGALERLGYGPQRLAEIAKARGKGIVYVQENCFGYNGEWAGRPGWQQIADCVSGLAWEQGRFMGLEEPVVPPFPVSDYGTGCVGAIAALVGLYHRATQGGSWHGQVSLLQYDLLLFKAGLLPEEVLTKLREGMGEKFLALRHSHSVDQISGTALQALRARCPEFFETPDLCEKRYSNAYKADVSVVRPVVQIEGHGTGFKRSSRPNGFDRPSWDFHDEEQRTF